MATYTAKIGDSFSSISDLSPFPVLRFHCAGLLFCLERLLLQPHNLIQQIPKLCLPIVDGPYAFSSLFVAFVFAKIRPVPRPVMMVYSVKDQFIDLILWC